MLAFCLQVALLFCLKFCTLIKKLFNYRTLKPISSGIGMAVFFIVCDLLPSSDYSVKHILKVAISAAIGGAVAGIIFGGIFKFNRPVQNKKSK